jgi:MFS family permease
MVKEIVHKILKKRHFWREMGFDELSELYISMMFRGLAISLTGLFVPVYMLKLGYDPTSIMMVVAWYFTARFVGLDIASAYTVAKIGPKHTMLIGYIFLTCSTAMFLTIQSVAWPVWLIGIIWGASASFFFIPFHVDFSKVKHKKHGGKELGFVQIMERVGGALGPIIGGVIATVFGAQYIFLVATILLIIGILPLFRTAEPVKLKQQLDFISLPYRKLKRDYFSAAAIGVENTLCIFLWPLFLGLFVLLDKTVYVKLGLLSTASISVSILAAYIIGKTIDKHKGRPLLRVSAIVNALVNIVRPFVTTFPIAFMVNVANEVITAGYRMPYYKGLYDAADDLPGYRIVYLSTIEWFSSLIKASMWWLLVLLTAVISTYSVIFVGFSIAAIASCLIMIERFRALNKPRRVR